MPQTGKYGPLYDEDTEAYGPDEVYTETKLNSAYAFGGPKCLVKVIQKLSGLSINRFMAVDFAGFAKMVDALGGVEVCSTTPLEDYELGTVLPNAGRQIVDGHTALNYVRARQVTTETNGDYGRIKRQQLFLSSLLRSMISKEVFFSLNKLNNVVNHVHQRQLRRQHQHQGPGRPRPVAAGRRRRTHHLRHRARPRDTWTSGATSTCASDDTRAIFDAIINDDPLPEETQRRQHPGARHAGVDDDQTPSRRPASTGTEPPRPTDEVVDAVTTDPTSVTVQVSNSTGEDGLGATAASELQQHGFNVDDPRRLSRVR